MKRTVVPVCLLVLLAWAALHPPAAAAVPDGVPLAWGLNSRGELGNGTLVNSAVPVQVINLSNVVAVAGGHTHSLALRADGAVFGWGPNSYGQLGNGTLDDSAVPVLVSNLAGIVAIAGHGSVSMALKSDGTVWAWGENSFGELGIGTFGGYRTTPVKVSNLSGVVGIAGSWHCGMALKADGTVWTWGNNDAGQLGDGTFTDRSKPVQVRNLPAVVKIAGGGHQGYALAPDGTIWAWGHNLYGQLGDGSFTHRSKPVQVRNANGSVFDRVVAIGGSYGNSIALREDDTVWSWGRNNNGQLGRGTVTADTEPSNAIPGQVVNSDGSSLSGVAAIPEHRAAGPRAIKSDGSIWAWGWNGSGELGIGDTTLPFSTTPVQVLGKDGIGFLLAPIALGSGNYHDLAVELAPEYSWSGVLDPVNVGSPISIFKKGSTVELKFKLTGTSTGIQDAQARFGYAQINSQSPGGVNEPVSNAAGTSGILFQYDGANDEYRYNWRTTGLGMGFYRLRIDLGDGVMRTVVVGLK